MTLAVFPRQTTWRRRWVQREGKGRKDERSANPLAPSVSTSSTGFGAERTGNESLVGVGAGSAVNDSLVGGFETARLEHLTLVLDQDWLSARQGQLSISTRQSFGCNANAENKACNRTHA
jgi:hypothetical protein